MTYFPRERESAFDRVEFIAWDCEGITTEYISSNIATRETNWTETQKLVLIAVSTGETLYDEHGISLLDRLEFIRAIGAKYPKATHVFFGASYDFNKILEGLTRKVWQELHNAKRGWTIWREEWLFRYRPRKELTIAHVREGEEELDPENIKAQCDSYIRFWDVIGFFQCSFVHAVETWLGVDYPDYDLIVAGKALRLHFAESDREFMERYNRAEVLALVEIMKRLHVQLSRLGLKLSRWDGAGAVAAEIFKRHRLIDSYFTRIEGERKSIKIELPEDVLEATRYAYFGGRIESGKMGRYAGEIYNYDINSAYPFAASKLPNLNNGEWRHLSKLTRDEMLQLPPLAMIRVRWYFHEDRLYYPFPFRTLGGAVIFPKEGERWIYAEEVKAALRHAGEFDQVEGLEAWFFYVTHWEYPNTFSVIGDLYAERQQMTLAKDPAEKVLKLGLNSIYGKLCQKLGWDEENMLSPRYHFLLFAGFITSYTRARIYDAIAPRMNSVVAICTDGIISTEPLDIRPSLDKGFGEWSLDMSDEIVQLQSGVYWLAKKGIWKEKARGLGRVIGEGETPEARNDSRNRKILHRIAMVERGWYSNTRKVYFPVKLFITSKKACISDEWFKRLGHWYEMHDAKTGIPGRSLELLCSGWGKRRLTKRIMSGRLTNTVPAENISWSGPEDLGDPYELPWIDGKGEQIEDDELAEI